MAFKPVYHKTLQNFKKDPKLREKKNEKRGKKKQILCQKTLNHNRALGTVQFFQAHDV